MATNSSDFIKAFGTIQKKRPVYDILYRYVNGPQPLRYSTERLEEIFSKIHTRFEVNWCNVIVQTSLDRLVLNGFDISEKKATNVGKIVSGIKKLLGIDLQTADKANATLDTSFLYSQPNQCIDCCFPYCVFRKSRLYYSYQHLQCWSIARTLTRCGRLYLISVIVS